MAIKKVVQDPNPVLRKKAKKVASSDLETPKMKNLLEDMMDTLYEQDGAGLAAPQIGVSKRIFVIPEEYAPEVRTPKYPFSFLRPIKPHVYINPEIETYGDAKREIEEGCLSVRGVFHSIVRPHTVVLKAQDELGRKLRIKAEGLLARIYQHEVDHLNGTLFYDHLHEI